MSLCILGAGKLIKIATTVFTLHWTHSVEKVEWRESWSVSPAGLTIIEAGVKGSGAGMEPGDGAKLVNGWWRWKPDMQPLPSLSLAESGATVSPWHLCTLGKCVDLGKMPGSGATLRYCD